MAEPAMNERQVQIVRPDIDDSLALEIASLESILLKEDVKDKPVVVVSVAGAYRKGKSFLLGFFLRYMRSKTKENWLQDTNAPLKGFSWCGGSKANTMGILLWSRVFLVQTPEHGEVAVLFLDTQGSFDPKSTLKHCACIFALSTLVSSVQIYNISQGIQMDHLNHLELFADYGRLVQQASAEGRPFQKLLFLVRDWSNACETPYGADGGRRYFDGWLKDSKGNDEGKAFQESTLPLFANVGCFLMPHPGLPVSNSPSFDGRLSDIEKDFKTHLAELVPSLLAPENLLVKEINGKKITCQELTQYIKAYVKIFNNGTMPCPTTVLQATADVTNMGAANIAIEEYKKIMEALWEENDDHVSLTELKKDHCLVRDAALALFSSKLKMGGDAVGKKYEEKLRRDMDSWFKTFYTVKDLKTDAAEAARKPLLNVLSASLLAPLLPVGAVIMLGLATADAINASNAQSKDQELAKERARVRREHDLVKLTDKTEDAAEERL